MATLTAQFCSPDEQRISAKPNAPLHCLTRNESVALAFVAQSGALSLFACALTYALIVRNIIYHARRTPGKWRLIKAPMDVYVLSLFIAEAFLSIGGFINGKWVQDGKLRVGSWCTAQSVGLTIGAINVASSTLAIAVHTFIMVWCNRGFKAIRVAKVAIAIPWIYSFIYVIILGTAKHGTDSIFRPAPYWCWVGKHYMLHRLFGAYLLMWISLFTSVILYIPMFFWGRGNITIGDKFWSFEIHRRRNVDDSDGLRRYALTMIAYPLVYAVEILPLSVARWIGFVQESHGNRMNHVPSTVLIAVQVIHLLSGVTNVLLFLLTRPNLLLFQKEETDLDEVANMGSKYDPDTDSIEGYRDRQVYGRGTTFLKMESDNAHRWPR